MYIYQRTVWYYLLTADPNLVLANALKCISKGKNHQKSASSYSSGRQGPSTEQQTQEYANEHMEKIPALLGYYSNQ